MRSEQVDTRAWLEGDLGRANGTDPAVRARDRRAVLDYWPEDLIERAKKDNPPYRLLVDPTHFSDVEPGDVHEFVRWMLENARQWPSIDGLRRRFGRVSNHRAPGEAEGQGSLL